MSEAKPTFTLAQANASMLAHYVPVTEQALAQSATIFDALHSPWKRRQKSPLPVIVLFPWLARIERIPTDLRRRRQRARWWLDNHVGGAWHVLRHGRDDW